MSFSQQLSESVKADVIDNQGTIMDIDGQVSHRIRDATPGVDRDPAPSLRASQAFEETNDTLSSSVFVLQERFVPARLLAAPPLNDFASRLSNTGVYTRLFMLLLTEQTNFELRLYSALIPASAVPVL